MATAVRDPLVGRVVDGRYRVESRIAQGGMATVYRATDTRLQRSVALKVMHAHLAHDPVFVERFSREARSVARLNHPGVVAVYDQGADADAVYLAMELVTGRTLRDVVTERGALPLGEALDVLAQVLDGLAAAHRAGLVHRDVKPENVLVGDDGRLRVADFGLARAASAATSASTLIGTVGYLAPELVLDGAADARADVYATGVVLFELLTGRQPFTGAVAVQVAFRHVQEDVPPPSLLRPELPADVDGLVTWATERDPARRPADAAELLAAVEAVRARLPAADLDRAPGLAPGAARDGSTRVVARARALALPLDEDPAAASAPPGRQPRPRRPRAPRAPAGASAARRPARRRRSRLLTAVLALLVLLGAGTWAALDGPLDRVTVPSVARASEDDARLALRQHHLQPAVSQRYDDAVPAGSVVTTVPRPGASVRENSAVRLVVSRGPQLFPVPALAGKTRTAAEAAVRAAHLAVGTVAEDWSETVPTGSVVTQEASGQALRRGSAVSFTVSRGREPIDLPALPGTPEAEAARRLTGAGLQVGAVTTEASDTVPAGQVVRSSPGTGPLHRGDAVALVVSSGPAQVAVPHVVGQRLDDARRALQAAGFTVEVDAVFGGFLGVVQGQSPDGGQAKRGSTVTLSVF